MELVPEVTIFAILTLAKRVAELTGLVGNATEKGAQTWATFVTILRTLKMRGHKPVQILVAALKSYVCSGKIQPLPTKITAND